MLPRAGVYDTYDAVRVREWFATVLADEQPPNAEQVGVLRAVDARCALEAAAERGSEVRSTIIAR